MATSTAPSIIDEVCALLGAGEKACLSAGLAIVAVLGVAAAASSFASEQSTWWIAAITWIVAVAGAVTAARGGSAHFRSVVADVSGWRLTGLLVMLGCVTVFVAWGAAFATVEALDAFLPDSGSKAEQQTLRFVLAATFWGGAGLGFMLTSLSLQIARAYPTARERAAFAVVVLVLTSIALPVVSPWL